MSDNSDGEHDGRQHDDTDRDTLRVQASILRRLAVAQRLAQVDQLYELATLLTLADLRRSQPDATDDQLQQALVARRRAAAIAREDA